MEAKFSMDTKLMDKIDQVKKRLGIDSKNYVMSIENICDTVLELMEKYEEHMEIMFKLLMEYWSDIVYANSATLKECLLTYQSIAG